MPTSLCITVRFLQPVFHGRGDQGGPEWPPSPIRLFQSLIAAAAAHWNERRRVEHAVPALRWLERQPPPLIIAARGKPSNVKYRLYVPDNVGDKVASSWSRGGTGNIADYRTEKDVLPTHLPIGGDAVHFLWSLSDPDFEAHKEVLFAAARSITHLGWGVDMVAGNATVVSQSDADNLPGERWRPTDDVSAIGFRVPIEGTLDALIDKHDAFLNRIGPEGFRPVPPLSHFQVVGYRRATDPPKRMYASFSLLRPDASGFRTFDTARDGIAVSAMLRHAASADNIAQALGWPPEKVAGFVLGHGESLGESHVPVQGPRLAFLPLPSVESRGDDHAQVVGGIRRALIVVTGGHADEDLSRLARLLSGTDLVREGQSGPVALLSRIPNDERMVERYISPAPTWATVTPVVLPGYDDPRKLRKRLFPKSDPETRTLGETTQKEYLDKLDRRIDFLLRKAIRQSGFDEDLARHAGIEWRAGGFWAGTELATRCHFPEKMRRFRRLHVRITWRDHAGASISIPGPLCIGGGRFHGLGLFAAMR